MRPEFGSLAGQRYGERCTLAFAATLDDHVSAVQLDDVSYDRQPDSQAAMRSHVCAVCLAESLEHMRQELGIYAFAVVTDHDPRLRPDALRGNADHTTTRRELDRVRQ